MGGLEALKSSKTVKTQVLLLLLMFSTNLFLDNPTSVVGLLPANTLVANKYLWNLVTSCYYEKRVVKLLLDLAILVGVILRHGIVVESSEQFGLYIVFNVLACTVCTSFYCFVRFFATGIEELLLEPMYGFSAILMAVAMYVRAYKCETSIFGTEESVNTPHGAIIAKLTYNNLPLLMTVAHFGCYCISPLRIYAADWAFTCVSLLFSWSYCRFFYHFQEMTGSQQGGDDVSGEVGVGAPGQSFAFVNMFPTPLHIVVIPFTTAFYNIVALTGLFPALVVDERRGPRHHLDREIGQGVTNPKAAESPFLKDARPDVVADRRRARALKLLDAKMAELNKDNDDEEDEGWGDDI